MSQSSRYYLLALLITGMALAGSAVIGSVPQFFGPHDPSLRGTTAVYGFAFLVLAAGAMYLQRDLPRRR